jgi:hypothetical protein
MKPIYCGTTFDCDPSQQLARHPFKQVRQFGVEYSSMYRGVPYRIAPNAIRGFSSNGTESYAKAETNFQISF